MNDLAPFERGTAWRDISRHEWEHVVFGTYNATQLQRRRRSSSRKIQVELDIFEDSTGSILVCGIQSTDGTTLLTAIPLPEPPATEHSHMSHSILDKQSAIFWPANSLENLTPRLLLKSLADLSAPSLQGLSELNPRDSDFSAHSPTIHSAKVWGEVIAKSAESLVVRFDVDGVSEEREFLWSDLQCNVEELSVGTELIGITQLMKANKDDTIVTNPARLRRIRSGTQQELKQLGADRESHGCRFLEPDQKPIDSTLDQ